MARSPLSWSLVRRASTLTLLFVAASAGCASSPKPPSGRDVVGPCVSCTPESYCAAFVPAAERVCAADDDCESVRVTFEDKHCSFGWYGGSFSVVAAKRHADAVRARLAAIDPCEHHDKVHYGSVCRAPPIACVRGACAHRDGPAEHAF